MGQQKYTSNLHSTIGSIATGNRAKLGQQLVTQTRASSNNTLASAKFLGTFPSSKKTIKDAVGTGGAVDFYRIDLTEKSKVRVIFANRSEEKIIGTILGAAGRAVLFNGKKQAVTLDAGETQETLIRGSAPGVYYLKVKGPAKGTNRYEVNLFVNRSGGLQPLPCECGT